MRKLILLIALLAAVPAFAQERPIAGTTVQTTDTTANSVLAGCAVGSTTCTGGVKAGLVTLATGQAGATGPTVYANATQLVWAGGSAGYLWNATNNSTALMTLTNAGVLSVTGVGAHSFTTGSTGLNEVVVRSSVAGTATASQVRIGNDADSGVGRLFVGSSTFTTSGPFIANNFTVASTGAMNVGTTAAVSLSFWTNNLQRWGINSAGDHTFGASSHIADSSGTPVNTSGWGSGSTIAGNDYAFVLTIGTTAGTGTGVVTFGHTFSSPPICSIASSVTTRTWGIIATTTTLSVAANLDMSSIPIYVLCRGY
jgi:hypothetical protein